MPTDTLPRLVDREGEIVRLVTATDLLQYAGLGDPEARQSAELASIADAVDGLGHLASIASEAKVLLGEEARRRMDRRGVWTLRAGGLEFKAPSPEAGTTKYDDELLAEQLAQLVEEDVIDADGAAAALEEIEPTTVIGEHALYKIREALNAAAVALDSDDVALGIVQEQTKRVDALRATLGGGGYKQKPAGIKALLKLGKRVQAAIANAEVEVNPPPARNVTMKPTDKGDTQ